MAHFSPQQPATRQRLDPSYWHVTLLLAVANKLKAIGKLQLVRDWVDFNQ
jgi:hypothetical protein